MLLDLLIFLTVVGTVFFLYQTYGEKLVYYFFGPEDVSMSVRDVGILVEIADSPEERKTGLAGVTSLPENRGMLFIFEKEGRYGFWMKDVSIPLDMIWIDDARRIVHIEENVQPDSYPLIYTSPVPARFVLEVNAFFVSTFNIAVGDTVTIPLGHLPADLREE